MYNKVIAKLETILDGVDITIAEVVKNNDVAMKGLTIKKKEETVAPVIYISQLVEQGRSVDEIVEYILDIYHAEDTPDVNDIVPRIIDYSFAKQFLRPRLVNAKTNSEMLSDIPHSDFLSDLTVYVSVDISFGDSLGGIKVTQNMIDAWGQSFDDVYRDAMNNMCQEKPVIVDMCEILGLLDDIHGMMYIISNERKINGAVQIMNDICMRDFTQTIDSDLIVIPSSIHECILLPVVLDEIDISDVDDMIRIVNRDQLLPEEILSDHAYIYRKDGGWYN